jgi:2-dehydropantoate 2-reductase
MRVCVFGAGAVGGHLAARLAQGGADVSIVVRGAHLAAVLERGLRVHAPDGSFHVRPAATDDAATLGPQDAVLVSVKAPALSSVAASIAPLLGPRTPVVFVANGIPWWYFDSHGGALDGTRLERLDPGQAVRRAVAPARVIGGVVHSACTVVEPGVVEVDTPTSRLILGEPDGRLAGRLEAIAAPLRAGGLKVELTPRIRDAIWRKLLHNLGTNPACVLAQAPPREVYGDPVCAAALRASVAEVKAIAAALGCEVDIDVEAQLAALRTQSHRSSILQDLQSGRPMEIDAMFDAPLHLAGMVGVATPTLDLLVALVKVRARMAGLYQG